MDKINLTLKSISEFIENPPEDFAIYGAGAACGDILTELKIACKKRRISRRPRYIIDKNAASIVEYELPDGEKIRVLTLDEYSQLSENNPIMISARLRRLTLPLYAEVIRDIYKATNTDLIFIDNEIENMSVSEIMQYAEKDKYACESKLDNFFEIINDPDNLREKVEFLSNYLDKTYEELKETFVVPVFQHIPTLVDNERLFLFMKGSNEERKTLYLFGACYINEMLELWEVKDKFNNFAKTHNYKIENFSSAAQTIFDAPYMILGINFRQEDIVVLQICPVSIGVYSELKVLADTIILINNFLKKKSVKLLVHLLPLLNKPENKKCYYERLIPIDTYQISNFNKFLGMSNYITSTGVSLVYNTSLNESKEFIFINFHHYTKRGLRIIANEIIHNLENFDFFDDSYIETIAPDVKKAEFNYLDNLIGEVLVGIDEYAAELQTHKKPGKSGAIVMNCNPCTNGHMHLIRTAAAQVDNLIIFVVEEDKSDFLFEDRIAMVRENCKDIKNVTILPSGKFIISTLTFPEYFIKAELLPNEKPSVTLDVTAFAVKIAPALGITVRFAGEEPFDEVTREYNREMQSILPFYGVDFIEIPRAQLGGAPISASRVRKLLEEKDYETIKTLVPEATYDFLRDEILNTLA
jgi:phosphopantetheine adenylyltransferase